MNRRRIIQSTHSSLFSLLIYSYHVNQKRALTLLFVLPLRFFSCMRASSFYYARVPLTDEHDAEHD